jgi:hypothetical protein
MHPDKRNEPSSEDSFRGSLLEGGVGCYGVVGAGVLVAAGLDSVFAADESLLLLVLDVPLVEADASELLSLLDESDDFESVASAADLFELVLFL